MQLGYRSLSVTVFPKKMFDAFGEDPRLTMKTASGEIVRAYGSTALHGEDTEGVMRKLNGNVADVRKILVSAAKMHERGYATWLGPGGGEIIPINHPINKAMNEAYHAAVQRHGKDGVIPVVEEDGVYNFYLKEKILEEGEEAARSPDQPPPPGNTSWGPNITHQVRSVPTRDRSRTPRFACAVEAINAGDGAEGDEPEQILFHDDDGAGADEPVGEERPVDEAGEDEVHETRRANPGWSPKEPTPEERAEQGHATFRSWCKECLEATGYAQQHRRRDHAQDALPTITMDFFYMGDKDEEKGTRPYLVARDRQTGMMMATMLGTKGTADVTGQKLLTRFIELLGYKEVVLKSDGEPALVKMKTAAGKAAKCTTKVVNEESPAGDSRANGEAESAVREIKWRVRAVHLMVERKFGVKLTETRPLMTWVPRYAAEQANRFKVGIDGKTAEERRAGKRWVKPTPVYGEKIMVKPAYWEGATWRYQQDETGKVHWLPQQVWLSAGNDE